MGGRTFGAPADTPVGLPIPLQDILKFHWTFHRSVGHLKLRRTSQNIFRLPPAAEHPHLTAVATKSIQLGQYGDGSESRRRRDVPATSDEKSRSRLPAGPLPADGSVETTPTANFPRRICAQLFWLLERHRVRRIVLVGRL